jgi:serine/threonine-protein kinase
VGIWRWLPGLGLGVVAERPHDRFALPLYWLDGLFATLLAGFAVYQWRMRHQARTPRGSAGRGPTHIGPYRVERLLGEGAMSRVYLARHRRLERQVALKLLKLHQRGDELGHRFHREARLASSLAHPNIVTVYDHGQTPDGGFYYTMEYIQGLTLARWVEEYGPMRPDRCIRLLRQITAAVAAMHARRLLHRDIKPENVMAYAAHGEHDLIKLLDFGLIRDFSGEVSRDLTRGVRVLGTPAFMAPERLSDPGLVDLRTDLYGIGCIGFWLLTGRRPFEATLEFDLAQQVLHVEATRAASLSPFRMPDSLDQLIADCLAKERSHRPESARVLLQRLDQAARDAPWNPAVAAEWWRRRPAGADPGTRVNAPRNGGTGTS